MPGTPHTSAIAVPVDRRRFLRTAGAVAVAAGSVPPVWAHAKETVPGPAFVGHFRGAPHVHVWVHVADDPSVELNA